MATVTKAYDPEEVTLAQALEIIAAKIAKGPSTFGKGKKAAKEKPVKEEKAEKKPADKKPAAKKAAAKGKKKS